MNMVLASGNPGKYREFRSILDETGILLVPQEIAGVDFEVNETGSTFEENAFLKASAVMRFTGMAAVADDSGLCIDALDGAPGLYSARFGGGKDWSDEEKNAYLLEQLRDAKDRSAHFVCCVCCCLPDGRVLRTRGECHGRILEQPDGDAGFGFDPIFAPDGYDRSFGSLGMDIKNEISHRARAILAFRALLEEEGIC